MERDVRGFGGWRRELNIESNKQIEQDQLRQANSVDMAANGQLVTALLSEFLMMIA